ncbi:hypothetical protein ILYODFUR_016951 [Ilyodon furcidens]|uniref:Uncharacterized protein n=1 Tax=Ilyodon furcidens TaxID=33524 RepID=A0ABV0U6N3_9TELE
MSTCISCRIGVQTQTHILLPRDKKAQTVNHCWWDDRQQAESTMHKAMIFRGWYRLVPLSSSGHTQRKTILLRCCILQIKGAVMFACINQVFLTYCRLKTPAVSVSVSMLTSTR